MTEALAPSDLETELVARALDGDRSAFGRLYETYFDPIYRYCRRMLRTEQDAEDVVSEVWLRATERLGSLRDPAAFKGWLYAIARNACLSLLESRKREVPLPEDFDRPSAPGAGPPEPEAEAEAAELRDFVWSAAETFLNPRDYTILQLVLEQDLGSADVAEALDIKPSHAYVLVNRLKDRVQDALAGAMLLRASRQGREHCPGLAAIAAASSGPSDLGPAVRKHVKSCEECQRGYARYAATAVPLLLQGAAHAAEAPPAGLRDRVWERAQHAMGDGWPSVPKRGLRYGHLSVVGGVVAALVVAGVVGAARPTHDPAPGAPVAFETSAPDTPSPSVEPVPTEAPQVLDEPSGAMTDPTPRPRRTPGVVIVVDTPEPDDEDDEADEEPDADPTPPTRPRPTAKPVPGGSNDPTAPN